jgi:hypothetical protein
VERPLQEFGNRDIWPISTVLIILKLV